jgi:hypothetical protein
MKSEFVQEAKDLTRKLNSTSEVFSEMYRHLKRTLLYQMLILFTLISFVSITFFVPHDTRNKISYMIIPLIMFNYVLIIIYRNYQKRNMEKVYKVGADYMGRLSDIIDWTSIRNKYINKEDRKVLDSITTFLLQIEKPLSPFRHSRNYYSLILYLSLTVSVLVLIYYIVYSLSLFSLYNLSW